MPTPQLMPLSSGVAGPERIAPGLAPLAVPIESLVLDPANVRRHGARNLEAIQGSLRRFGQQKPIIIDADGVVIAGNGTLEAARSLGWLHVAAVRTDLLGPDRMGFAIADNRTAELAEWDYPALVAMARDLDPDLMAAAGWSDAEASALLGLVDVGGEEAAPLPTKHSDGVTIKVSCAAGVDADGVELIVRAALEPLGDKVSVSR